MELEQEVRNKVDSLLQGLLWRPDDPETYEVVLNKLTRMAILGTLPPGGRRK